MEDTVTLDTPGPKEHLPVPRSRTIALMFSVDTKAQERTEKCPGPHVKPLPPSIGSPQGSAPLTGAQAEACAPQLATGQGPMVPERELSTGLAQVSRTEAIINHGVIERGAEAASHHPCPLAAGLAVIRQHQTVGGGGGGWRQVATPSPSPEPTSHRVLPVLPHNVHVLWLLPENWPQTLSILGPLRQPPLRSPAFKSYNTYSQDPRVMSLKCSSATSRLSPLHSPPEVVSKLFKALEPFLQDKNITQKYKT